MKLYLEAKKNSNACLEKIKELQVEMFLAQRSVPNATCAVQGSIVSFFREMSKKFTKFEEELDVDIERSENIRDFITTVDSLLKE